MKLNKQLQLETHVLLGTLSVGPSLCMLKGLTRLQSLLVMEL